MSAEVGWLMHSDPRRRWSSGIRTCWAASGLQPRSLLATLLIISFLADRIVGDHEISAAMLAV
ncbi:MAG TPA: hypothetical protein VFZ85_05255 [Jiangellaceae bacterium]